MAHYEPKEMYDGFSNTPEEKEYIEMSEFIDRVENIQANYLAEWSLVHLEPKSIADLGCNNGIYLAAYIKAAEKLSIPKEDLTLFGTDAIPGVEEGGTGGQHLSELPNALYIRHDLRYPFAAPGRFDLAICFETMEHMEEHWHPRLVDSLYDTSDTVLFTCAVPGQGGSFHKGERTHEDIIRLFEERHDYKLHPLHNQLREDLARELGEHRQNGAVSGWLLDNVFLFQRDSDLDWEEPTWTSEPQEWLGGETWRKHLEPFVTVQENEPSPSGEPKPNQPQGSRSTKVRQKR